MKILVLSQYWYPENGVPQRRWQWLTRLLIEAGHEVRVVAPPPSYPFGRVQENWVRPAGGVEEGPAGEKIVRSAYRGYKDSLADRALSQLVMGSGVLFSALKNLDWKPDVIVGTVPALPIAVVTEIVAKVNRSPYVIDLRDAWPELLSESRNWNQAVGQKSLREKLLKAGPLQLVSKVVAIMLKHSFRRASALIVTSKTHGEFLRRTTLKHRPEVPIEIVRNVFPRPQAPLAKNVEYRDEPLRVLYAGTLGRAQNLVNVLRAARELRAKGIEIQLRFVGGGAAKNSLQKYCEAHNLNAEFISRIPADEMPGQYDWADTALVHLTDWEPLNLAVPSKTFELMEAGIHITGVVTGESAELIESLHAGHVVPQMDKFALAELWEKLSQDRSLLETTNEGREWVETERSTNSPRRLLEVFQGLEK